MKSVDAVRSDVRAKVDAHLWRWAQDDVGLSADEMVWPLTIALGVPTERAAMVDGAATRAWVQTWATTTGTGTIRTVSRSWPNLGSQRVPTHLDLATARDAATFARRSVEWNRACRRLAELLADWPNLRGGMLGRAVVHRALALEEVQWQRVRAFLRWADDHPLTGYLPRQIPVPGVDSKWFESHRAVCTALRQAIRSVPAAQTAGLDPVFGLRILERELFVRFLDDDLSGQLGGLSAFSSTPDALARLTIRPTTVVICENLQTALAFGPQPGVAIIGRAGYAVDGFGRIPWLRTAARLWYWGDLDTHGFAILNRVRTYLPQARSILMDRATLLEHRALWDAEKDPARAALPLLTADEQEVYAELRDDAHGPAVRLEQERIAWSWALDRLVGAVELR